MRIAKYPAQSNAAPIISLDRTSIFKVGDAAPNNFVNEVYVRAICSPVRGKLDEPDFYVEGFSIARLKDLMKQTSIFKVGDAAK
jgi:hypothetical protein